ncbi:MAG: hypothetical protein H6603_03025 [Flavobacteriales bacterium]|nr:hypothetical protein [Flavobacteriales bacterium]MCB9203928.1 hypothetical protein [Flavobacteriales bacterium]
MHSIEPYYRWRDYYIASEDIRSPFYGREYSEFEFTDHIYDFVLHPQWDDMGSPTLYLKILYAEYEKGFAIIELIGEWNDLLYNDIMILKRDIVDLLIDERINKFILVGENVLNFHYSDDEYYNEWFDDVEEGWIVGLNFRNHVIDEMKNAQIDYYINLGGKFQDINWRTFSPNRLFELLDELVSKRLQV